ncbi:MAG TPA: phospholipase D-like domain-containing protein [Anaerolineales bacterium]|nr:phospholipase D-like domain-containing protein [Anaerolineales bacterium]
MDPDDEGFGKIGIADQRLTSEVRVGSPEARAGLPVGPSLAVVLLVGLFLAFWFRLPSSTSPPGAAPEPAGPEGIWVYFTAPQAAGRTNRAPGIEAELTKAIDQAGRSVDIAVYALNLGSVTDALLRADQRGVNVRLIIESDNASEPEVQALLGAGIPLRQDNRPALMHHKFVVIDGAEVWSGSMNLTVGAALHDDNNLLRIASAGLAKDFTREFDEMFVEDRFGALSSEDTPQGRLTVAGVPVEVLFSPDDGVVERIISLIDGAQTSLEFAAFSFTSDALADHILAAAGRGVRVRGVMETSQASGSGSEYENLRASGLEVRPDGNPFNMHHKFLIIDQETVITGSYNFTISAEERNDENVLIIHDTGLAQSYLQEFLRLFEEADATN